MANSKNTLVIAPGRIVAGNVYQVELESGFKNFLICDSRFYIVEKVDLLGSAVINGCLNSTVSMFLISPFDPLFLVVPLLFRKLNSFCMLEDILQRSCLGYFQRMRRHA